KRMGISVFWCLLPTMKGLTTRGMRLAQKLRGRGLKVIESYPGAAQDLLGIPRKGSSLEELKWGLSRAGIKGDFLHGKVTHDAVESGALRLAGQGSREQGPPPGDRMGSDGRGHAGRTQCSFDLSAAATV